MSGPTKILGFAIVSDDGMLADSNGVMPSSLKFEADQKYFADGMDRVQVAIHGRHSHEQQPHSPQRHRITVTGGVRNIEHDASNDNGIFWNPSGAPFERAWEELGVEGAMGVVGGTSVFGLFLDSYTEFHLSRAPGVKLAGGRPVFPGVPSQKPEGILARHGLKPGPVQTLDAAHGITVTVWTR